MATNSCGFYDGCFRSKAERKNAKKVAYLYKIPSSGQLIVHPEDGGSPRARERLPSVDMLRDGSAENPLEDFFVLN